MSLGYLMIKQDTETNKDTKSMDTTKPETKDQETQTEPKTVPNKPDTKAKMIVSDHNKECKETETKPIVSRPKLTYAETAKNKTKVNSKVEKAGLLCLKPRDTSPTYFKRLHISIHIPNFVANTRRDVIQVCYRMLQQRGARHLVKDISVIGRSILEVYVNERLVEIFKQRMNSGENKAQYIDFSPTEEFSKSIINGENQSMKMVNRLAVLCVRNQGKAMQTAILINIDDKTKERILTRANDLQLNSKKRSTEETDILQCQ